MCNYMPTGYVLSLLYTYLYIYVYLYIYMYIRCKYARVSWDTGIQDKVLVLLREF